MKERSLNGMTFVSCQGLATADFCFIFVNGRRNSTNWFPESSAERLACSLGIHLLEHSHCHQRVSQRWPSPPHTRHIYFASLFLTQSRQRMGRGHRDKLVEKCGCGSLPTVSRNIARLLARAGNLGGLSSSFPHIPPVQSITKVHDHCFKPIRGKPGFQVSLF